MLTELDSNDHGGPPRSEPRFERLYQQHSAAIYTYAMYRDPTRADDVVADTFAIAWRRFDEMPAEPLPWLYGVARRVVAGQWRSAMRQQAVARRLADEVVYQPTAPDPVLFAALGKLDEPDRELILLMFWHDLSLDQCAAAFGIGKAALSTRLWRARRRLRAALDEQEHTNA